MEIKDGSYYASVTTPGFRDPVRLALEMGLTLFGPVMSEPGWFDADFESWDLAKKIQAAWLALPKCPCCGDDDHDGIFPLIPLGSLAQPYSERYPRGAVSVDEKVCPKCRPWARQIALTKVTS
jgi:hypothetical protein